MSDHFKYQVSFVVPATSIKVIKAINSLLESCLDYPVEIIVIFNNCPESEAQQVRNTFRTEYDRGFFKVIHIPKSTIGGARNEGIRAALGKYVVHMDDDCFVLSDYIDKLIIETKKEFQIAKGDVMFLAADNFWDRVNCKLKKLAYSTRRNICYTPNLVVNIKIHESGFTFDEKVFHGEDTELSIRLINAGISPISIPQLVMFHKSKESLNSLTKKYFQYGVARVYRFKKWQFNESFFGFYKRLFGEIPPLSSFSFRDRLGILTLYFMRDIGVLYGLITKKFV